MTKITLDSLISELLKNPNYIDDYRIYAKDGDGEFHIVDSIDVIANEVSCIDGWYQYFDSFRGDYSKLYYKERE